MTGAVLVHLLLQGINQAISPGLDLVFHIEDLLPLPALLLLQSFHRLLCSFLLLDGFCKPGLLLSLFQPDTGFF